MKRTQAPILIPVLALLGFAGLATIPITAMSAEDEQAEREARRIEGETRRMQEQARRDTADRDTSQAEALRGQEDAIRRLEEKQSRIDASSQQIAQRSMDQARADTYTILSVPPAPALSPVTPAPLPPAILPGIPAVPAYGDRPRYDDPVSGMSFASLTEQLGSYFGAQSGVLVVVAGAAAPYGLQDGDVILSVDGRVPADGAHVSAILRSYRPGERVKLQVQRQRKTISLDTTAPVPRRN